MEQTTQTRESTSVFAVASGIWGKRDVFVNYYFIEDEMSGQWALIDAGLKWSADDIITIANELFGEDRAPAAIILTHGHFDHVGSARKLMEHWNVPVFVHEEELPYVTGVSAYPPPDPEVGGGMMSTLSGLYPAGPIDLSERVRTLPYDGSIPGFPEWRYIHTPGHSPGHISLFREKDKVLIAGDALTTTKAESAFSTLLQSPYLGGPPKYFTCNWASAKFSVMKLEALRPRIIASGHGRPMEGEEMLNDLDVLATHFDEIALPSMGRYVNEPAVTNNTGVAFLPPKPKHFPMALVVLGAAAITLSAFLLYRRKS